MTDNWREAINQTINTAKIEDINQYVAPSSSVIDSPIFYSKVDEQNSSISTQLTMLQCKNRIKREFT